MKKVVRMLGLCALVALAFTACKKNDTQKVSFTATMPQTVNDVRTHANDLGTALFWDEGNTITVLNAAGQDMDFTLVSFDEQVATFTAEGNAATFMQDIETADYVAFYPAVVDDEGVRMTIPAEQTYEEGVWFANDLYPMVGFNEGSNFVFQSNCGFLFVQFKDPLGRQADRVVLTANEDIAGDLVYAKDGLSYVFEGEGNVITMTCDGKQPLYPGLARDFTFVLPEGVLANGFTVEIYDGETCLGGATTQAPNPIVAQQFLIMPTIILGGNQPE
jgi:hypothetical protein